MTHCATTAMASSLNADSDTAGPRPMDLNAGKVYIGGKRARLEYDPEEKQVQVFVGDELRGSAGTTAESRAKQRVAAMDIVIPYTAATPVGADMDYTVPIANIDPTMTATLVAPMVGVPDAGTEPPFGMRNPHGVPWRMDGTGGGTPAEKRVEVPAGAVVAGRTYGESTYVTYPSDTTGGEWAHYFKDPFTGAQLEQDQVVGSFEDGARNYTVPAARYAAAGVTDYMPPNLGANANPMGTAWVEQNGQWAIKHIIVVEGGLQFTLTRLRTVAGQENGVFRLFDSAILYQQK